MAEIRDMPVCGCQRLNEQDHLIDWPNVKQRLAHAIWEDGSDYRPGAQKTMLICETCQGTQTYYKDASHRQRQ